MQNKALNYNIFVPSEVEYIIETLNQIGFEAFVVGGSVRDSVLGLAPSDWDITTNALPEEVLECFKAHTTIPTGIQHGTVTVISGSFPVEITTYRQDGEYINHRRPDTVDFTKSLREDLSRRDFTINAMAYNKTDGLIDYYGGLEDLENKIIRCVGDPEKRFNEDALRIFRCVRFASQLDFNIEDKTRVAMQHHVSDLIYIAEERIQVELTKSLLGDGFKRVFLKYPEPLFEIIPELKLCYNFEQNTHYHIYDVYEHTLVSVASAPKDEVIRLAMLFHDIGKPHRYTTDDKGIGHFKGHTRKSVEIARDVLKKLRYSNNYQSKILMLVKYHDLNLPPTSKVIKRWLNKLGEEGFKDLMQVQRADAAAKAPEFGKIQLLDIEKLEAQLEIVLEEKQCFSISQLDISGSELLKLGIKEGPQVGITLNQLVDLVIEEEIENKKEHLIKKAKELTNI